MHKGFARCKANQAYTAFHRGEGVWGFGKDAEIERPKALCKDAYKWSFVVGAGRTDNKRPRLHRCRANQAYTAFHGERGFGKDAEIERFVGFAGRKAHKAFLKG